MHAGFLEEGDQCKEKGCAGKVDWHKEGGCSCHINPPCHACTNAVLKCVECGWEDEPPDFKYAATEYPGLSIKVNKPRPFDNTKIDYRIKSHTNSSQICEGVYPEGATREEVREKVNGTFGGRFEYFRNSKFKFIAYTD